MTKKNGEIYGVRWTVLWSKELGDWDELAFSRDAIALVDAKNKEVK